MDRIGKGEELRHEEGTQEAISELKNLMSGQRIWRNSSDLMRLPGNLGGVAKTLLYGEKGKSPTGLEAGMGQKGVTGFR